MTTLQRFSIRQVLTGASAALLGAVTFLRRRLPGPLPAESEQRYHSLGQRVPVGIYRTAADGHLIDANPALAALLGFDSVDQLRASGAADLYLQPEERDREQLPGAGDVVEVDRQYVRPDGTTVWLRDRARAVRGADGRIEYYEGALQDVTERVRAQETVSRSEARFRSLIENASDGVLILSEEGLIRYQSPAIARMLGYTEDEWHGKSPFALVHPDDLGEVQESFINVMLPEGHGRSVEFRCRHKDGTWRVLHIIGTNLLDDPVVNGIVVNMIDLTMHRSLEQRLQQAQRMEAVGRLAGGIAHDFNNLLTAIRGYTDLLGDRVDVDARAHADVLEIRRAVERAARLTRQLLAFSRRQVVRPRATDLGAVIAELEQMLRRLISANTPLYSRVAPHCWVHADAAHVEQVVVNLVLNARDAAPRTGITVTVAAATIDAGSDEAPGLAPGAYVLLSVEDDGCGIQPDVLPHIFEPFFTTKEVGQGTGLGLATVYGIVQDSGGCVFADSAPGVGTRMSVYLPRIAAASDDVVEEVRTPEPETGTELVLLAEDEPAVRSLAERVLMRHGYHVLSASTGVEALQLARSTHGRIDLLVTDVVMPEMGGVELAERLLEERPDLRVLFMSGYAADSVPGTDARGRTLHFLEKPFSPAVFADMVRRIIDEASQPV